MRASDWQHLPYLQAHHLCRFPFDVYLVWYRRHCRRNRYALLKKVTYQERIHLEQMKTVTLLNAS